jgi:hypothetical protein
MIRRWLKRFAFFLGRANEVIIKETNDPKLLALGSLLDKQQWLMSSTDLNHYEFKIFSEWGDDGIIQYLIKYVPIESKSFIEFGVENYTESNTRFLLMNNNWSGFVLDGSEENMRSLKRRSWFFKYDLRCKAAWINRENINELLSESGFSNIGLLHIDLDGNDYFILESLDLSKLNPSIIIMEYNFLFGKERAITTPYDPKFERRVAHFSNLYFGASLAALVHVASKKGYSLVGCNLGGNNAYFVRNDLLNDRIKKQEIGVAFKAGKFRQGRDRNNQLMYLSAQRELEMIKGLPVINVMTGASEVL